jgi:3-hydroxybutyrate dehydrogenase
MSLQGKTALVTGSTSGIGLGIALCLAKAGANLVLNGFGDASKVIEQVGQFGGKVGHHPADVSVSSTDCRHDRLRRARVRRRRHSGQQRRHPARGRGRGIPGGALGFKIIAINLSSVFHSTRLSLPGMRSKRWGRIVNIASVHGQVGSTGKAAYVAAKHGVIGLTKVVGLETATSNVTCNAICPGWVLTPLVQKQIDDRAAETG